MIAIASDKGINDVYLVTDTAERYFVRQGYRSIDRRSAPEALRASTQFAQVCPGTATVMHKNIIRTNVSPTVAGK